MAAACPDGGSWCLRLCLTYNVCHMGVMKEHRNTNDAWRSCLPLKPSRSSLARSSCIARSLLLDHGFQYRRFLRIEENESCHFCISPYSAWIVPSNGGGSPSTA